MCAAGFVMLNFATMQSVEHFYYIIKNLVSLQAFDGEKWESIQAFAVIENYIMTSDEQLGKTLDDLYKPYFFSERWRAEGRKAGNIVYDYPGLFILPGNTQYNGIMTGSGTVTANMEIAVLEQYLDKNGNRCNKYRNVLEIFRDTERLLVIIIKSLQYVSVFTTTDGKKIYLPDSLAPLINGITKDTRRTSIYRNMIKQIDALTVTKWQGGANNLYGAFAGLSLQLEHCRDMEEWDLSDWILVVDGWLTEGGGGVWKTINKDYYQKI